MLHYHRPKKIEEALTILEQKTGVATPFAGGTDLLPRWSRGVLAQSEVLLDLKAIEELKGASIVDGEMTIGACTTIADLAGDPLVRTHAPLLAKAADSIASPQIRNRASLGGNLCNASPAADTAVPLLLHDAVLDVAARGEEEITVREIKLSDFFRGPGSTLLEPNELVIFIRFAPQSPGSFAAWEKFGTRPAMEIALASAGIMLERGAGRIERARVGYGSVAPVPMRGRRVEALLLGKSLTPGLIEKCEVAVREEISPISDQRAGERYRREIVGVLMKRMLMRALEENENS